MLPFDHRPWAKKLAAAVILCSITATVFALIYLHDEGPLDTAHYWIAALFLFAILPPNIAILFRRNDHPMMRKPPLGVAH